MTSAPLYHWGPGHKKLYTTAEVIALLCERMPELAQERAADGGTVWHSLAACAYRLDAEAIPPIVAALRPWAPAMNAGADGHAETPMDRLMRFCGRWDGARPGEEALARALLEEEGPMLAEEGPDTILRALDAGLASLVRWANAQGVAVDLEVDGPEREGDRGTLLMREIWLGRPHNVETLLELGADPHARWYTPYDAGTVLERLVQAGARGRLPRRWSESLAALVAAGLALDSRFADGDTPLMSLAGSRNDEVSALALAEALLEHGANPNESGETGTTALHLTRKGSAMAKLLLRQGARPDALDFDWRRADAGAYSYCRDDSGSESES